MMPKFDTENGREKSENGREKFDFWSHFDSPGGRREVRRASLRGWQGPGFSYLKRLTPAGVGGF